MGKRVLSKVLLSHEDEFFKTSIDAYSISWQRPWLENFTSYADKYKCAVEKLTEVIQNNSYYMDQLTYPIMFLTRHTLELRLKAIILVQEKILSITNQDNKTKKKQNATHSLSSLWDKFDKLYDGEKTNEQYKSACKLTKELDLLDGKSDTFRYPIHNDGSLTSTKEFVDINEFVNLFMKLDVFFEGIEEEINQELESITEQKKMK